MADEYTAGGIEVVTLREAVRKRPGMYAGGTDGAGALHVVLEVVANAVDQVLLGRCTRVDVRVDADDTVTITDDGPGIPADMLVGYLERPSDRPTADGHRPHVHLSPIGLGLPVSNALCDPFEVETVHAGVQAVACYTGGLASAPLRVEPTSRPSGTRVRLRPDPALFHCLRVPRVDLTRRLEELGFLIPAMTLSWTIAGEPMPGLVGCVRAELDLPLGAVAHHRDDYATLSGPIGVEVALAWRARGYRGPPQVHSFANLLRTEAGPHVGGLLAGARAFLPRPLHAHGLDGLVAAVSVFLADARYGSPTRDLLVNAEVRAPAKQATLAALQAWAERHPAAAAALRGG